MMAAMNCALVTGSSRGIGAAVARELCERGWSVLGLARSAGPTDLGDAYTHVRCDLSEVGAFPVLELALSAHDAMRSATRLALVNNAGSLEPMQPLHRVDPAQLSRSLNLNLVAPVWLMGLCLRSSEAPLRIVNLSSGAATNAYPGWSAYCAGKAALKISGEAFALEVQEVPELEGRDVRLVSYAPHVVATSMQEAIRATRVEDFPRRQRFIDMHEEGALVDASGPAREIADLLAAEDLPALSTLRFEP